MLKIPEPAEIWLLLSFFFFFFSSFFLFALLVPLLASFIRWLALVLRVMTSEAYLDSTQHRIGEKILYMHVEHSIPTKNLLCHPSPKHIYYIRSACVSFRMVDILVLIVVGFCARHRKTDKQRMEIVCVDV